MATDPNGSVTAWIGQLLAGDRDALAPLMRRYFDRLADVAGQQIPEGGHAGGDDLANSAFVQLWRGTSQGQFADIVDRNDLWRLLRDIINLKVLDHYRYLERDKRPPVELRVRVNLDKLPSDEPDPELVAAVDDEFRRVFDALDDDEQRAIAQYKLQGYEIDEIAARLDRAPSTIHNKLKLIRAIWQQEIAS